MSHALLPRYCQLFFNVSRTLGSGLLSSLQLSYRRGPTPELPPHYFVSYGIDLAQFFSDHTMMLAWHAIGFQLQLDGFR